MNTLADSIVSQAALIVLVPAALMLCVFGIFYLINKLP